MDYYRKLCKIDMEVLTSDTPSIAPLNMCQISKGLVRELFLFMSHNGYKFRDVMHWLSLLVPPPYKSNFDPCYSNTIRKRIQKVNRNLPSKLEKKRAYLNERFDICISSSSSPSPSSVPASSVQLSSSIQSPDTPRRAKLKRRNYELTEANKTYSSKVRHVENELVDANKTNELLCKTIHQQGNTLQDMDESLKSLSTDYTDLESKVTEECKSRVSVHRSLAATKKHLNAANNRKPVETATSVSHRSKKVSTEMSSCVSADIFTCESSTSPRLVRIGKKYLGGGSEKLSSKLRYVAEIPIRTVDCVNASRREVRIRATEGMQLLNYVASPEESHKDQTNVKSLIVEMMKQQPGLFADAAEEAGLSNSRMLSPQAAVDLQSVLRITNNKMRDLRTILSNCNAKVLPSERQMNRVKAEKVSHVDKSKLECGEMYLRKSQRDPKIASCPFVRVKSLVELIEHTLQSSELNNYPEFDDEIWLLFSGDKGGDSMKFVFSIINDTRSGSVDNNHIYCMYAGSDSLENMWKVFHPFISQLKNIQDDNFVLCGRKVKVFLGGDYHFLDDMLGHGGSSSSFPSSADFVSLQHLQNHPATQHSLKACNIPLRTVEWYKQYYNENRCDSRNNNNMRDNAKNHYSVIDKMLFPIKSLNFVTPAILHITLGVVLRLFDMVEDECRKLDGICTTVEEINRKEDLNRDWEEYSFELQTKMDTEKQLSGHIIELENNLSRVQAVISGNMDENIQIAKSVNASVSGRVMFEGHCNSVCCILTVYDQNPLWVTCDSCNKDYHTSCEGYSASEEIGVIEMDSYICLKCNNAVSTPEDIIRRISDKATKLLNDEDDNKIDCVKLRTILDKLKSDVSNYMGPRENLLNDYLNEISVVRQAYHGHVLVGNDCVKVLKKHVQICEYIKDSPVKDKVLHLFRIYASLQPLLYANRFLTDEEINTICSLCEEFGTFYPTYFPDMNIFRKVHELVCTVPRFVKEHRTIGLLSEQSSESLHAAVKNEARSLSAMKSKTEKLRLQFVRQELRSKTDKSILQREGRLCQNKHNAYKRVFLRTASDAQRHCPVCEPTCFDNFFI